MLKKSENELLTGTGPGTPMGRLFRRFWLPALLPSELPSPDCAPVRFRILGEDLIAFRSSRGDVAFFEQACPHRGASLFFGRNEEDGLRCVYHGWKFDAQGNCVDMPSEPPESNFKDRVKVISYPGVEYAGIIWIYMGPREKQPELPQYEWCLNDYPELRVYKWLQESNYTQGLEGNIDTSHSAFLHRTFHNGNSLVSYRRGGSPDTAPKLEVMDSAFGFVYGGRREREDGQYYWRVYPYVWPTFVSIASPDWNGSGIFVIPSDDEHSWWITISPSGNKPGASAGGSDYVNLLPGTWRQTANRSNDYMMDREMQRTHNFTGLVGNRVQDAAVTESMGAIFDRSQEHLGTTDMAIIHMRRNLIEMARSLDRGIEPKLLSNPRQFRVRPVELVTPEPSLEPIWREHHSRYSDAADLIPPITTP